MKDSLNVCDVGSPGTSKTQYLRDSMKTDAMKKTDEMIQAVLYSLNRALLSSDIDNRYDAIEDADIDMRKLFDLCVAEDDRF